MFDYQDQVSGQFMEEKISYAKKKKNRKKYSTSE